MTSRRGPLLTYTQKYIRQKGWTQKHLERVVAQAELTKDESYVFRARTGYPDDATGQPFVMTLAELSSHLGLSEGVVRQLEVVAMRKIAKAAKKVEAEID